MVTKQRPPFPPFANFFAIILLWPILAFALRLLVLYGMSHDFWRFPLCNRGDFMISLCEYGFLFFVLWYKGAVLVYGLGVAAYLFYAKMFKKPVSDVVIFLMGPVMILFVYWWTLGGRYAPKIPQPGWFFDLLFK